MAKFFKEDVNKSKKKKRSGKNKPGALIADLNDLGGEHQEGFLKGFPKTPAEIAEEEEAARIQAEAEVRAAQESAKRQEEENRRALWEAEHQKEQKQRKPEFAPQQSSEMHQPSELPSGEVKTTQEKLETKGWTFLNGLLEGAAGVERSIGRFFLAFVGAFQQLGRCLRQEVADSFHAATDSAKAIKGMIGRRIQAYYRNNPDKRQQRQRKNRRHMRRFIQLRNTLMAKEKAASMRMAGFINRMDRKNEKLADKTNVVMAKGNRKFNFLREWAEINKRKLLLHFAVLIVIALCGVEVFSYFTAYEYAYNGRTLGTVKKQEDVLKIVDIVSEQLSKEHNAEIYIDKDLDITFNRVTSFHQDIDDTEEVLKRLTYMKNMNAKAYAIYVNDLRVAIVDSRKTAKTLLNTIKSTYMVNSGGVEYETVGFKEKIQLKQIDTKLGRIQNADVVMQKLMTGAVSKQVHTVVPGDTLTGIAAAYGMATSELKEANPNINPEKLNIGQEIILTKPAPMVTIKTVEVATYPEAIAFETEYKDTDTMYKGENSTEVSGVVGTRSVTARITRENGVQTAATILSSEVLSNPTTEVVLRGTKVRPSTVGTGNLRYPVSSYRLSSKFGPRWGRMHYGIDLACPVGTKVSAADGGTVTYSGYSGSYGYVVKINHGNGMLTLYAHCSKLLVKKGDKVYQGQQIALSGNTGRSTGPHCHFQVEINGTPKNPLNYL
ncbi:peptidoglycan DD-metalloendopeptidase family protein [Aminipila butyrica]|uniref:Peptidoglycan DD-metalloendopeptidase family protein n=1 Tax=Aminipila butyrica TaxID=433296 RepID=A0A858BQ60_9FIRM|nr:peptidoglycan DD-metalloendopeptidase family protein [Aminipila butyrica]QIB68001.1 peptidoglycan DD-metalloendopeptidase family protein [Aminipila butyrica]